MNFIDEDLSIFSRIIEIDYSNPLVSRRTNIDRILDLIINNLKDNDRLKIYLTKIRITLYIRYLEENNRPRANTIKGK